MRRHAQAVAQPLRMGSSPYARELAAKYHEGGLSAKQAVEALRDVIRLTREGYEFAIKNHQRIDDDSAQTFNKGM